MNEQRPWWKLSWPAVLAGLVMLGALAVKNLDGTHWIPAEAVMTDREDGDTRIPWTSKTRFDGDYFTAYDYFVRQGAFVGREYGWPKFGLFANPNKPANIVWLSLCGLVGLTILAGTLQVVERWQRTGAIRFMFTLKGMIAVTGAIATSTALFLNGDDFLWTIKPLATGVLFVGIILTCFAVIDWIGSLWSLVSRRLFARSNSAE